jgi:hypothetical protein
MSKQLNEPITDNGIRNTNFFNGRLLTARDLQTDQQAERSKRWQLGRAIGDGVVEGLDVTLQSSDDRTTLPVVGVKKGLAINRKGQVLSLPNDDEVTLIRRIELPPPEAGVFGDCGLPTSTFTNLDRGVYLFVVGPASTFRERAPMRSVEPNNALTGCGSKYAVEGVQFDLIKLEFGRMDSVNDATRTQLATLMSLNDPAAISKLRNIVAHICFDSEEATPRRRDPFKRVAGEAGYVNYGGLAALRRLAQLTDCQVPLALIYWSGSGVAFVDNWAARRLARRVLELDVLSILRSYGYERLLQFEEQVQDLFDRLGGLAAIQIQNYFQYLPAVGYFPVTGSKSPRGFHPTTFFRQLTTGSVGVITTERFGALLRESFACPDIDLQTRPLFQVYQAIDNSRAVAASTSSSQLYQIFVSRSLNGPLARDGVSRAFSEAWEVYRSLIKRHIFIPAGFDEEKHTAQLDITAVIRDVIDMANRQAALAGSCALNNAAALDAFQDIYRVQKELTTVFRSPIPGITHTGGREAFAAVIDRFLDEIITDGSPGLMPSIQAQDLAGAVKAQNQINNHVGTFTGGVIARGPFGFRYLSSPRGTRIVPGTSRPSLPHNYAVLNNTDRRVTINLEGSATALHGAWDASSVLIQDTGGHQITEVTLNSGDEGNIVVMVLAPNDAAIGETATVTLIASIPPPTDRSTTASLPLDVASSEGPPVHTRVAFDDEVTHPGVDPTNVAPSNFVSYFFNLVYSSEEGPQSAEFDFNVDLVPSPAAAWTIEFQGVPTRHDPATTVYSRDVTLSATGPNQVEIIIGTPARGSVNRSATFRVNVRSKTQPAEVNALHPDSFTLTVRP